MRRILLTLIMSALFAPAAFAQSLYECDWKASVHNINYPWAEQQRSYANGNIQLIRVDTGGEPVCCSQHLVIIYPAPEGYSQCAILSDTDGSGFLDVYLEQVNAAYDPARGLLVSVPVGRYDYNYTGVVPFDPQTFRLRINQATGTIAFE